MLSDVPKLIPFALLKSPLISVAETSSEAVTVCPEFQCVGRIS